VVAGAGVNVLEKINLAPSEIQTPNRPAHSWWLYRLRYCGSITNNKTTKSDIEKKSGEEKCCQLKVMITILKQLPIQTNEYSETPATYRTILITGGTGIKDNIIT
jgi:hypothetical protein